MVISVRVIGSPMIKVMSVKYAATSKVRFVSEQDTLWKVFLDCLFLQNNIQQIVHEVRGSCWTLKNWKRCMRWLCSISHTFPWCGRPKCWASARVLKTPVHQVYDSKLSISEALHVINIASRQPLFGARKFKTFSILKILLCKFTNNSLVSCF